MMYTGEWASAPACSTKFDGRGPLRPRPYSSLSTPDVCWGLRVYRRCECQPYARRTYDSCCQRGFDTLLFLRTFLVSFLAVILSGHRIYGDVLTIEMSSQYQRDALDREYFYCRVPAQSTAYTLQGMVFDQPSTRRFVLDSDNTSAILRYDLYSIS